MELSERLDGIRQAFEEVDLPAHHRAALDGNIERLEASGAAERALGLGEAAPEVSFRAVAGALHLRDALERGPVVLSWFRGRW